MRRLVFSLLSLLCLASCALAADPVPVPVPEWIWSGAEPKSDEVVYFRKTFSCNFPSGKDAAPKSAILVITCDNHWIAYINGEKVSTGDEWAQPNRVDITKLLQSGVNAIAVEGRND